MSHHPTTPIPLETPEMYTPSPLTTRVQSATRADVRALSHLIAAAFAPLAVCHWLVPDPTHRIEILTDHFEITVDHALTHGHVDTTPERLGAAVWLPSDHLDIDDYDYDLEAICGRHLPRFRALDATMTHHHPTNRHDYLAFLAVAPTLQGRGIGGALLTHHHATLDREGRAAYLEAVDPASTRLYQRHGYRRFGDPLTPDDADADLYPMWRDPQPTQS